MPDQLLKKFSRDRIALLEQALWIEHQFLHPLASPSALAGINSGLRLSLTCFLLIYHILSATTTSSSSCWKYFSNCASSPLSLILKENGAKRTQLLTGFRHMYNLIHSLKPPPASTAPEQYANLPAPLVILTCGELMTGRSKSPDTTAHQEGIDTAKADAASLSNIA